MLIDFALMESTHSGENMAHLVYNAMKELNVRNKVWAMWHISKHTAVTNIALTVYHHDS